MVDELQVGSGPLARRLGAHGGGRRAVAALVAGGVGLGAFAASLLLEWVRLDVFFSQNMIGGPDGDHTGQSFSAPHATFGPAYQISILALATLLGAVVVRPDLAARLRLAATALGIGAAGVVLAIAVQLRGTFDGYNLGDTDMSVTASYGPGGYCAAGAVVALVAGVWLAAAPSGGSHPATAPDADAKVPAALGRLVGGQPAMAAFVGGIAGAAGIVASMLLTWQRVDVDVSNLYAGPQKGTNSVGLTDSPSSIVYLLGVLALLGLVGLCASRPDLAARLRFGAAGLGLGLAVVLVGLVFDMRDPVRRLYGFFFLFAPAETREQFSSLHYEIRPGLYFAGAAVIALVAGIWLAAAPQVAGAPVTLHASIPAGYVLVPLAAAQTATPHEIPAPPETGTAVTAATPQASPAPIPAPDTGTTAPARAHGPVRGPAADWLTPVGHVDGLTVTASEPVDLGSQGDILRS